MLIKWSHGPPLPEKKKIVFTNEPNNGEHAFNM